LRRGSGAEQIVINHIADATVEPTIRAIDEIDADGEATAQRD